jgi:hypothetical protein
MRNRIALLVSVLFAGVAFTATSLSAAPADDECLAKPKGVAPAGKHWYYQTDRSIQRKCWYLGDAGEKTVEKPVAAAPRKQSAPKAAVDPGQDNRVQPPTADARAEWVDGLRAERPSSSLMPQTPAMAPAMSVAPQAPATPVMPPQAEAAQPASDGAATRNWNVASRWPDPSDTLSTSGAASLKDPAPAPQVEIPAPVAAATPEQESTGSVHSAYDVSFAPLAAAIFLVVIGGAIVMFLPTRRRNRRPEMYAAARELPRSRFGGAAATRRATTAVAAEQHRLRDEIEQLLEVERQARRS